MVGALGCFKIDKILKNLQKLIIFGWAFKGTLEEF